MNRVRKPILNTVVLGIILTMTSACSALAGETEITMKDLPTAVLASFHKAYPKAEIKGTAQETEKGETYFEIESVDNGLSRDLLYLADGTVVEIEESVDPAKLPASVKAFVKNKYPHGKIAAAEKNFRDGATTYDLRVVSGETVADLVVGPKGKLISMHEADNEQQEESGTKENDEDKD